MYTWHISFTWWHVSGFISDTRPTKFSDHLGKNNKSQSFVIHWGRKSVQSDGYAAYVHTIKCLVPCRIARMLFTFKTRQSNWNNWTKKTHAGVRIQLLIECYFSIFDKLVDSVQQSATFYSPPPLPQWKYLTEIVLQLLRKLTKKIPSVIKVIWCSFRSSHQLYFWINAIGKNFLFTFVAIKTCYNLNYYYISCHTRLNPKLTGFLNYCIWVVLVDF